MVWKMNTIYESWISSTIFLDTENKIKMAFWSKLFDLSYWLIEYLKVPSACLLNFTCLFQHFGRLYTIQKLEVDSENEYKWDRNFLFIFLPLNCTKWNMKADLDIIVGEGTTTLS